jgi:hydrogenase maturation protease
VTLYIVGVGEPMAGDDGVGIRVIERLRGLGLPPGTELFALRDPSMLATLLAGSRRAVVVDAVLDPERSGEVRLLGAAELAGLGRRSISSHGVDALTAVELARALSDEERFPEVSFLTIAIARPDALGSELSPAAAQAVERAAELCASLAAEAADA